MKKPLTIKTADKEEITIDLYEVDHILPTSYIFDTEIGEFICYEKEVCRITMLDNRTFVADISIKDALLIQKYIYKRLMKESVKNIFI